MSPWIRLRSVCSEGDEVLVTTTAGTGNSGRTGTTGQNQNGGTGFGTGGGP
jgi:hypothetical protein